MSNLLLRGAAGPIRKLQGNVDLSSYSVKFEKCQFVKAYADDLAAAADEEESTTAAVAATELAQTTAQHHFAIFRLCPNNTTTTTTSANCTACDSNYGEYLMNLDDYLETTVTYFQRRQEEMCNSCRGECRQYGDENASNSSTGGRKKNRELEEIVVPDCDTCLDECDKIENMEANGYYDATNFLSCQLIYDPAGDGNTAGVLPVDSEQPLWAAPICASGGYKIKIGVFRDENCQDFDSFQEVDDYLFSNEGNQMKLSHAQMKMTYMDTCISCQGSNNGNTGSNNQFCDTLYNHAAKCEKTNGFVGNNGNHNGYGYNQLDQEEVVCDFLESLKQSSRPTDIEG
jgi:hypothetical protein